MSDFRVVIVSRGLEPMIYKASTSIDLSKDYPSKYEEKQNYEKKAKDLTIDYLTSVRKHVIKTLSENYGAAAFKALDVSWVMTVPALWSPEAQNATRECAEAAGMGNASSLMMTSEPEAGAAYALRKLEPHNVKIGHSIVVCDAGGGTADLVTYRIKALSPILKVAEAGIRSGGKCGSTFLNRIFEHEVDKRVGRNGMSNNARAEMMKQWEFFVMHLFTFKHSFRHFTPTRERIVANW